MYRLWVTCELQKQFSSGWIQNIRKPKISMESSKVHCICNSRWRIWLHQSIYHSMEIWGFRLYWTFCSKSFLPKPRTWFVNFAWNSESAAVSNLFGSRIAENRFCKKTNWILRTKRIFYQSLSICSTSLYKRKTTSSIAYDDFRQLCFKRPIW